MKNSYRKVLIFSLLPAFLWSIIFCCCSRQSASVPSCHQSMYTSSTVCAVQGYHAKSGSCSCKQNSFAIKEKSSEPLIVNQGSFLLSFIALPIGQVVNYVFVQGPSPGLKDSTTPLYLLNRVLRI